MFPIFSFFATARPSGNGTRNKHGIQIETVGLHNWRSLAVDRCLSMALLVIRALSLYIRLSCISDVGYSLWLSRPAEVRAAIDCVYGMEGQDEPNHASVHVPCEDGPTATMSARRGSAESLLRPHVGKQLESRDRLSSVVLRMPHIVPRGTGGNMR